MAQQTIGIGSSANDGTGDPLRTAFDKTNDNFTELYNTGVTTGLAAANGGYLNDVRRYGAVADALTYSDGAISSGSYTFSSASHTFVAGDVGKSIAIDDAGAAGVVLVTTIASVSSGNAVLTDAASATVSGKHYTFGTDSTAEIQAALDAGSIYIPQGAFLITDALSIAGGRTIQADGAAQIIRLEGTWGAGEAGLLENANPTTGDDDIQIIGGIWDGRGAYQVLVNVDENPQTAFRFKNNKRITMRDNRIIDPIRFSLLFGDIEDSFFQNQTYEQTYGAANGDGLHICGPANNITIRDQIGLNISDDVVGLIAADTISLVWTEGAITNVHCTNVTTNGYSGVRVISGRTYRCDNITFDGVHGTADQYAVIIGNFSIPDVDIGRVVVKNVDCQLDNVTGTSAVIYVNDSVEHLVIDGVKRTATDTQDAPLIRIGNDAGGAIYDHIEIRNIDADHTNVSASAVLITAASTVTRLVAENITAVGLANFNTIGIQNSGIVDVQLSNIKSTGFDSAFATHGGSGGGTHTIARLSASNITQVNGLFTFGLNNPVEYGHVALNNIIAKDVVQSAIFMSTNQVERLVASNVFSTAAFLKMNGTNTGQSHFSARGVTAASLAVVEDSQNFGIDCPDVAIDASTISAPISGDTIYNSNAAAANGIGLRRYDGSLWQGAMDYVRANKTTSGNQTITADNTDTLVTWDEVTDTGGRFASNRLTPGSGEVWGITCTLAFDGNTYAQQAYIENVANALFADGYPTAGNKAIYTTTVIVVGDGSTAYGVQAKKSAGGVNKDIHLVSNFFAWRIR